MANEYWMANAEYVNVNDGPSWLIGEDENAHWWVSYRDGRVPWRTEYLWARFNRYNPLHWLRYWNSKRRNQVVFLFG